MRLTFSPGLHRVVSFAFFLTVWMAAAIFSGWLGAGHRAGFPRLLLAPGLTAIAASIVFVAVFAANYRPNPGGPIRDRPGIWAVAYLEWAALLSLLAWIACVALALVRQPEMEEPARRAGS